MMMWQTVLMGVALAGLSILMPVWTVLWCNERELLPGRRLLSAFRRLPWFGQFLILACVTRLIVYGSTKAREYIPEPTVTAEEIERGYRLVSVSLDPSHDYTMPADAVLGSTWDRTGAADAVVRDDFGSWRFPFGTNTLDHLWLFVPGFARPEIFAADRQLSAVDAPMSAVPGVSRLWIKVAPQNRMLTWENFVAGRTRLSNQEPTTNNQQLISGQLELHRNGDFVTRSNEVAKSYRRVDPNDWDGDGLPNDRDPHPYTYDGDNFGPNQELPEGANPDAYCWVDVVVRDVDALVTFEGDAPSNLEDPVFMARAGETNRVTLLIGKTYSMRSNERVEVVSRSSSSVEVFPCGDATIVRWPVEICAVSCAAVGLRALPRTSSRAPSSFTMSVLPFNLTGTFTWTNVCCSISGSGNQFAMLCRPGCSCGGCEANGIFSYEGFTLPATGGFCGCDSSSVGGGLSGEAEIEERETTGVTTFFDKSVIFFEDAYSNTPTETVPWMSTTVKFFCSAYGGESGGMLTISVSGVSNLIQDNGLPLPMTRNLAPYEHLTFTNSYRTVHESAREKDIRVVGTFVESGTDWTEVSQSAVTAVKVKVEPSVQRDGFENRHVLGIREDVGISLSPNVDKSVSLSQGWVQSPNGAGLYRCPVRAAVKGLNILVESCGYTPNILVVEPQGIVCASGVNRCEDGCIAMELEPYVEPMSVSFFGIAMMEVPTTYPGPTEYFNQPCFESIWYHTRSRGAGDWKHISPDNFFFADTPSFAESCPTPLGNGTIDWAIPLSWGKPAHTGRRMSLERSVLSIIRCLQLENRAL